jgi:hypothetical protein
MPMTGFYGRAEGGGIEQGLSEIARPYQAWFWRALRGIDSRSDTLRIAAAVLSNQIALKVRPARDLREAEAK